jgi:hypothetical protein
MVATALATCRSGEWIDVDTLFITMRRGDMSPIIARTDRARWKLYLEDPQYGAATLAGAGIPWPAVVLLLVLSVLFGGLGVCLRYWAQVKTRHFEHVERMRALDKASRSQVADVVAKFGELESVRHASFRP